MRNFLAPLLLAFSLVPAGLDAQAPSLGLTKNDVLVTAESDGYHLFVRQVAGSASVLLSESFEPPEHKLPTYALRAVGPNFNDNEKRVLNGKFLAQPHHSLISSTPAPHPTLGRAFEVVIPALVEYGNTDAPNARYGKIDVKAALASGKPFWFSIRVFGKPYADYTGPYRETAFDLKAFVEQTFVPTPDHYETGLEQGFSQFGKPYRSGGVDDAVAHIGDLLGSVDSMDVVVCIDTTKSMTKNLAALKTSLMAPFRRAAGVIKKFRLGIVLYRDYMEDYLTRDIALTSDLDQVQGELDKAEADGGGDIPEAVVEALWAGLNEFDWQSDHRLIVLLGDAPQHPTPRGNVTDAMVIQKAAENHVELQMIMLPQTPF